MEALVLDNTFRQRFTVQTQLYCRHQEFEIHEFLLENAVKKNQLLKSSDLM